MDVYRIAKLKRQARGRSSLAHWPASRTQEKKSPEGRNHNPTIHVAWAPRLARGPPDATALVHQSGGGIWTLPRLSAWETISLNYCYGYDVAIGEPTCPAPLEAAHVRRVHLAPHARNACAPVERRSAATAQQFSAAWARPDLNRRTEPALALCHVTGCTWCRLGAANRRPLISLLWKEKSKKKQQKKGDGRSSASLWT